VRDEAEEVLGATPFRLEFEEAIPMRVVVEGTEIRAAAGDTTLAVRDDSPLALADGAVGLIISEGALSTNEVRIGPA
jgi:hypothetical protein